MELREDTLHLVPKHFFPEGGAMADCTRCLYWERPDLFGQVEGTEAERLKKEWFTEVLATVDICGMVALRGNRTVAWARFAPASKLPGLAAYSGRRPSPDAVFLACFAVSPSERGRGTGARFLGAVLEALAERGFAAVETYARKSSANNPSGPIQLYISAGFETLGGEEDFPLLRKTLRAAIPAACDDDDDVVATAGAGATGVAEAIRSASGRHPKSGGSSGRQRSASGRQRSPAAT